MKVVRKKHEAPVKIKNPTTPSNAPKNALVSEKPLVNNNSRSLKSSKKRRASKSNDIKATERCDIDSPTISEPESKNDVTCSITSQKQLFTENENLKETEECFINSHGASESNDSGSESLEENHTSENDNFVENYFLDLPAIPGPLIPNPDTCMLSLEERWKRFLSL